MILEYLQPDPDPWDGLTVLVRAGYHVASLGAAGLAMFGLGFGHRLTEQELARLRRWIAWAVATALALSCAALLVRVLVLSAGDATEPTVWAAVMRSRIGDAFYIRVAGLLLVASLAAQWRIAPALAGAGIVAVVASYAALGHSMLYRPRQELAALVTLHLGAVAFWAGSLPPLAWVAARGGAAAAGLVEDWSRMAAFVVALVLATGAVLAVLLLASPAQAFTSWYGNAFLAKIALVALTIGLAARHKLALAPDLASGRTGSAERLSRSITLEIAAMILIFYAAAELVSVHPTDLGHRLPG
jgi:putative copper export protein